MFCKHCGSLIADGSIYCSVCGEKQKDTPTESVKKEPKSLVVENKVLQEKTLHPYDAEKKKKLNRVLDLVQKISHIGLIVGCAGLALFLGIVIVGLCFYGKVYLFDGYTFTKVLSIISIICMIIGVCGSAIKCVLILAFKKGDFPKTIFKRVVAIVLVIACLVCSCLGISDCKSNKDSYSSDSGSGYNSGTDGGSGSYDVPVSKYLGLSLTVTRIEHSSGSDYTYIYCKVQNVSSMWGTPTSYRYIKVKGTFKDRYGSVIDTDWTYAVDSAWLDPGETKTFDFMVRNTNIKSASLSIMD